MSRVVVVGVDVVVDDVVFGVDGVLVVQQVDQKSHDDDVELDLWVPFGIESVVDQGLCWSLLGW